MDAQSNLISMNFTASAGGISHSVSYKISSLTFGGYYTKAVGEVTHPSRDSASRYVDALEECQIARCYVRTYLEAEKNGN